MAGTGETSGIVRMGGGRCAHWLEVLTVAACCMTVTPANAAGPEQGPTKVVKSTVRELHNILKEFTDPNHSEARCWEIEQVVRQRVHYQDMAKRSLGASWSQIDDAAPQEYVDELCHHESTSCGRVLLLIVLG
ncbi:MAG: ABC transporter substrate-binding protein [Nitrospira sp.]